jgi:hypothetical protein
MGAERPKPRRNRRRTAAPIRGLVIVVCVVGAICGLGLAAFTFMDVAMFGFPDSHVTDYEKAVDTPLTILAWVETACGAVFLALAITPIGTRARTVGLIVAAIAFVGVAVGAEVGVPWYYGTHLGLDNGIGG